MQLFIAKLDPDAADLTLPAANAANADERADAIDDDDDDDDITPLPASAFRKVLQTDDPDDLRGLTLSAALVEQMLLDELDAQNVLEPRCLTRAPVGDPNLVTARPLYRYGFEPLVRPKLSINADARKSVHGEPLGTLFTVDSVSSDSAVKQALRNVFLTLNAQTSNTYYRVLDNDDDLVESAPPTGDGTLIPAGLPLFQKMRHLSILEMATIYAGNSPADLPLGLAPSPGSDQPNCVIINIPKRWLWVPAHLPILLLEIAGSSRLFNQTANGWTGKEVKANRTAVYNFDLSTGELTGAQPKLPGRSHGGGAEARADKSSEADYWWQCEDMRFAAAIGLDPARRLKLQAPPEGFEYIPTRLHGLSYWKKWKDDDAVVRAKKNRPTATYPLPSISNGGGGSFAAAAENSSKDILLAKYWPYFLLRKKKKGEWSSSNIGKPGVPLKGRAKRERKDAGEVMRIAFAQLGYHRDGSATQLVHDLLVENGAQSDIFAIVNWQEFSHGLRARPNGSADAWLPRLRTDQEWCHLYGHGDGGNEELENFVSGSKHANTEQLAIELAQRTRPDDLTAKITAYQLPTAGLQRGGFTTRDKANLTATGWPAADWADFATFASMIKPYHDAESFYKALPAPVKNFIQVNNISHQSFFEEIRSMAFTPLPVALGIRYKISLKNAGGSNKTVKVFDHMIEAQRESFDIFQFRALYWAVSFAINDNDGGLDSAAARAVRKRLMDSAEKRLTKNGWTWESYGVIQAQAPVVQ